jgi:predicted enzyme related to lactoylglutathione lyase
MSERSSYAAGTPSWVDIGSPDLDKTHAFYTGLFGWERQEAGPPEETGGYGFYTVRGKLVAGYGPAQDPSGGVWWTTYVDVDDADKTAEAVTANGGSVLAPPMDVMTAGRMAVFADPGGAAIAIWQPGEHKGAQLVNEPGALSWNELLTRDLAGARVFYQTVFGWGEKNGPESPYAEFTVGDAVVAGAMAITPDMPAQVPAHWNVYFAVADLEGSVAKAAELGGQIRRPPFDIPDVGRAAIIGGPHNEGFSLFKLEHEM